MKEIELFVRLIITGNADEILYSSCSEREALVSLLQPRTGYATENEWNNL